MERSVNIKLSAKRCCKIDSGAFFFVGLLAALLFTPQGLSHADTGIIRDTSLNVFVSIPPQAYFVEAIGKERVTCSIMVGPGHSPATYEPTSKQIVALGKAQLYFRIGVPFETIWMKRISSANPNMKIVDTAKHVSFLPMMRHYHDENDHREGAQMDPHIWLSLKATQIQAHNIYAALVDEDPDHAAFYKKNLEAFVRDLDTLDRIITNSLKNLKSRKFIAFHPAWGYFARDYDLEQIPIELEGKRPSAKTLTHLIKLAESENIRVVIVQAQFSTRSAEAVAKIIGAQVVRLDPLGQDYLANMKKIADTLTGVMQ